MTSVTQKIRRFTGGINSQPDEQKQPGQVRDALNCTPDVVYGLVKRPGTNYITQLGDSTGKWFWINKRNPATGAERYVGQIQLDGTVRVWNLFTGKEQKVEYKDTISLTADFEGIRATPDTKVSNSYEPYFITNSTNPDDLQVLTVNDVTFVTNRKVPVSMSANCGEKRQPEGFIELRTLAGGTEYNLKFFGVTEDDPVVTAITLSATGGDLSTLTYTNNQFKKEFDENGLTGSIIVTRYTDPEGKEFFSESLCLDEPGTHDWKEGDTFTVTEGTVEWIVEIAMLADTATRTDDPILEATYTTPNSGVVSDTILDSLVSQIDGNEGFTAEKIGAGIYFTREEIFSVETTNGALTRLLGPTQYKVKQDDGTEVEHYVATATNVTELPTQCKHGLVALVSNTEIGEDDYYVQFYGNNNVDGDGVWEETYKPGIPIEFNKATMPHLIVRSAVVDPSDPELRTFWVGSASYITREVGDETTNPRPSFAPQVGATFGRPINNMIYYRNRLCFMVDENIVMSKAGDYFDFWKKTATTISPDDPIDLQTTSNYPSVLYNGIVNNTGLILFSQNNQWLVSTENDRLSPDTVKISQLSAYNFNPDSNPISLGTTVGFVGDQGKYTRFYEMASVQREGEPDVVETSKVVERLMPSELNYVAVSKENDMAALAKYGSRDIWLFRWYNPGNERKQSAWFRWQFHGTVVSHEIMFDEYYLVLEEQGGTYLVRCDLRTLSNTFTFDTETNKNIPGDSFRTYLEYTKTSTGLYSNGKTYFNAEDFPIFSDKKIIFVRTTKDNLLQGLVGVAKYDAATNRFIVNGDFDGEEFAFGYDYNMKVVMPTFFVSSVKANEVTSFDTGNFIVHRIKVSLGQVGYYTTTLKRLGRNDYTQEYEAKPMDFYDADELGWMPYYEQTTPIYQRNKTFNLIIESQNPSPAVLQSATLEGVYTENYYKRV